MGLRIFTDVAIDDFSMSPECFGLNIPVSELDGYNYYDPRITSPMVHQDFVDKTCKNIITLSFSSSSYLNNFWFLRLYSYYM